MYFISGGGALTVTYKSDRDLSNPTADPSNHGLSVTILLQKGWQIQVMWVVVCEIAKNPASFKKKNLEIFTVLIIFFSTTFNDIAKSKNELSRKQFRVK